VVILSFMGFNRIKSEYGVPGGGGLWVPLVLRVGLWLVDFWSFCWVGMDVLGMLIYIYLWWGMYL